ncbi:MAG: hypothetical protein MK135_16055, partial [Polyangiaceae bacterium]|nr:hypothetical protein [Polyangiaceae bacterium]
MLTIIKNRSSALGLVALALLASCSTLGPNCACVKNPDHPGCAAAPKPKEAPEVEYVLAEAEFSAALGKPREVEINKTSTYEKARQKFSSAAVRPPDNCLTESAAQVQGEGKGASKQLASQKCGV